MEKNPYRSSTLLAYAGGLMTLSGILMAVIGRFALGGAFWAAALCMFLGAWNFRLAENKNDSEGSDHA